jgi:RNA polymerase sigma-70 factor (ECF subfamily)
VLKDLGRKASRAKIVPLDEGLAAADGGGDPHERAVAGEAERRLADGLARLPRMQREVFLLRAQQGLEYPEIAAALETTTGAARVHYHHAVRRLKEWIQ